MLIRLTQYVQSSQNRKKWCYKMDSYWEQSVSNILCLNSNNNEVDLPHVTDTTLEMYFNYLKTNLVFPFEGTYHQEVGPFSMKEIHVKIAKLSKHYDDFCGLICEAKEGRKKLYIPMAELNVSQNNPNFNLVDDYTNWFWNYK